MAPEAPQREGGSPACGSVSYVGSGFRRTYFTPALRAKGIHLASRADGVRPEILRGASCSSARAWALGRLIRHPTTRNTLATSSHLGDLLVDRRADRSATFSVIVTADCTARCVRRLPFAWPDFVWRELSNVRRASALRSAVGFRLQPDLHPSDADGEGNPSHFASRWRQAGKTLLRVLFFRPRVGPRVTDPPCANEHRSC